MSEIANNNSDFLLPTGGSPRGAHQPGARSSLDTTGPSSVDASVDNALDSAAESGMGETFAALASTAGTPQTLLSHWGRYVLAVGLLSCYLLFFMSLYLADQIDAAPLSVLGSLGCWVGGFVWLVNSSGQASEAGRTNSSADLLIALWCNLGIVAIATLLGGELRLPLLVGVVFGLLYTGLQFSESRVRNVMLSTIVAYVCAVTLKSTSATLVLEFELLCALGFAVMLFASSLIAREIIRLRQQAQVRAKTLSHALRRVEELALRDDLTGLYNRRHLLDFVERAIASCERGGPSFALAYCDLDHFKRVNDRFGHECGDRLLQSFAQAALNSVRTNDLVARIGGEEFVLVLVDTDESDASDIVERLRMRTSALRVSSAEPTYKVTLSSGLASFREGDTVEALLRRADAALYEAKDQGRDRLVRA